MFRSFEMAVFFTKLKARRISFEVVGKWVNTRNFRRFSALMGLSGVSSAI
jgi:hypothetical protein